MDLLIEADTDASVQEAVFFAVADLLNLEVDLLFFDTTSTYFERDTEDPDPSDPDATPGFRRYGHSKGRCCVGNEQADSSLWEALFRWQRRVR